MSRCAAAVLVVALVVTAGAGCASADEPSSARAAEAEVAEDKATGAAETATRADPGTRPESPSRRDRPRRPASPSLPPGHGTQPSGAIGQVPDEVIQRQLRNAAERIARRMLESPSSEPTPVDISPGSNRALGYQLLLDFGFGAEQWQFLDQLWIRESGWNHLAENRSSGAYGIPQSLPASKMAVVGADWRTNPETQIRWGLAYIAARYGSPERAWAHSQRAGWY